VATDEIGLTVAIYEPVTRASPEKSAAARLGSCASGRRHYPAAPL